MLSLRLIVPTERTEAVSRHLDEDPRTTNAVVIHGSAVRPAGDLVQCEVTREAASDVLGWLRGQGIYDDGSVVVTDVAAAPPPMLAPPNGPPPERPTTPSCGTPSWTTPTAKRAARGRSTPF
jgi:hypothetical protein